MATRPGDDVLEIGCGHGVAAAMICEKLATGRLVAIDRSRKMIDASVRRNGKYIEAGIAEFRVADVLDYDPGPRRFDRILAVRVGLFHRGRGSRGGTSPYPETAQARRKDVPRV